MTKSRSMFKKTFIARALMVTLGAASLMAATQQAAYAQTNATGTIFGQTDAGAGITINIVNKETGTRRTVTPDATGKFSATSLATGNYKVEQVVNGSVTKSRDDVEVRIGQGSEILFATSLQAVVVTSGRQKIDVSSIGSTTTLTSSDLARLPIANNVGAIIQLAPNTTRGDSRYGGSGAPSFGGASASENAYYINGFPVTTLLTQVGFSQLPYNSIAQAQILTGGYGAEFGRSTGGVVNLVTKSGTNEFVAGVQYSIEPNKLRSREKDQLYENVGTPTDGKIRFYNGLNKQTEEIKSFYFGGPIIKDKLFFYFAGEQTDRERESIRTANTSATYAASAAAQSTRFQEINTKTPRYLAKLDWNLTDAHRFEYTRISDKVKDERKYYGFDYSTLSRTNVQNGGQSYVNWGPTSVAAAQGAVVDILKYTGYITDDWTVTALLGRTKTPHSQTPVGYNPNLPQVLANGAEVPALAPYGNAQGVTGNLLIPGAYDENKGIRLDTEYKLTTQHTLRAGLDQNTIKSKAGASTAGGILWRYQRTTTPGTAVNKDTAAPASVVGNPNAQQGYYVEGIVSSTASTPTVDQSAFYIEDRYQITPRVLLSLGLRNEAFDNKNGDGQSYIKLTKQLAPRFGATWDALGDASLKVTGSLGRYHVPLPTNVAVRGAGSSLNAQTNYVYTGVNPDGSPSGLTPISKLYSNNNEFGQAKDPRAVAAENLKGSYQDELSFGFENAVSKSLNVGAKFTYRKLKSLIDDHCDDRPFLAYAARNGINTANFPGYNCALFNPGVGNTFNIDLDGDGKLDRVPLSAADLGFPKVDRKYIALDLFAEHPFDGTWWGKATYTYSKNKGNTEGQTLSDIGQGDVATTQAFDFPEFSLFANGVLPNDRKHQLKLFGYYQVAKEIGVGGNMIMASGRPKNCIGAAPNATIDYSGYGSAYFYCNGVPSPRGSLGRLPTDVRLDVNFTYKPEIVKGLTARVDIFNLFNRQSIQTIEERYQTAGVNSARRPTYSAVESYTAPRSAKLTVSYDYKF